MIALRETLKFFWMIARYFLVCLVVMFITMCLATGKFPPPIKEVYHSLRNLQEQVKIMESTSNLAKAQQQQRQILDMIDEKPNATGAVVTMRPPGVTDQQRIQALEFEVASLKSKLARSQWETKQLKSCQPSTSARR